MTRLVVAVLLLAACEHAAAPPTSTMIAASSYDRACESSKECFPIFEGDLHDCSARRECPNAAINARSRSDYYLDYYRNPMPCSSMDASSCPSGVVECPTGQCQFRPVEMNDPDYGTGLPVSATEYAQTCTDVAECMAVYLGSTFCCDVCPNAAISAAALPQYQSDVARRTPICYPPICKEPPQCSAGRIACQNGMCALLFPN